VRTTAKGDYAVRAAVERAAAGEPRHGRSDRRRAGDPGQLLREHPPRPAPRRRGREPGGASRAATCSHVRRRRFRSR